MSDIKFFNDDNEVIRIDAKGFHYRGQFIADAGEAHRLLVEFLREHQPEGSWQHAHAEPEPKGPTDQELTLTYAYAVAAAVDNKRGPFNKEDAEAAQLAGLRAVLARWGHSALPVPATSVDNFAPNDLSHLSDEEFNVLAPQGYHATGPAEPQKESDQRTNNHL